MSKKLQTSILSMILLYLVSIGGAFLLVTFILNGVFTLMYANILFVSIIALATIKNAYAVIKEMGKESK